MCSGLGVGLEVTDGRGGWGAGAARAGPLLPLTALSVITHISSLMSPEALRLAGYPGKLPRPQSGVNPTWMMHFLPISFFVTTQDAGLIHQ